MSKLLVIFVLIFSAQAYSATYVILENSPYLGAQVILETELTTMECGPTIGSDASIVKAKLQGQPVGLFVKRENYKSFTIPYYEALKFKHNLGDNVSIYVSKNFTLYNYTFSAGKSPQLVHNVDSSMQLNCRSLGE